MRDPKFVAQHRGGLLTKENHRKLIGWARQCSEHVLFLINESIDNRLIHALHIAEEWENDHANVGEAMKASVDAHVTARESTNPVLIAVARSIGQTVATAHMADHSLGGALYALKAIKHAGKSIDKEKEWQKQKLKSIFSSSPEMVQLVLAAMSSKEKSMNLIN